MKVKKADFNTAVMKDAEWCNQLGFNDFEGLNRIMRSGKASTLVNLCEARHENRCSEIAQAIVDQHARLILLAGPSSSGKTSTSLRIAMQCKVHGLNPIPIELDDYFVDRSRNPRKADGSYDFECLEAMDIELLNRHLRDLVNEKEIELPHFDFISGKSSPSGRKIKLDFNDVLILEGIHALDPAMTPNIPKDFKFQIYVSDISSTSEYDPQIMTTDNRLLRRIVRDNVKRGHSPENTIKMWPSVREGEEKYIFPFQTNADELFNSTLQYELPLLKHYATSQLYTIPEESPAYPEAQRLLSFLNKIDPLPLDALQAIPASSIVREFIGGQILHRELL